MKLLIRVALTTLLLVSSLDSVTALPHGQSLEDVLDKRATTARATPTACPTPTVPIGAGGGPLATRSGRLFQIQSKTQYFAGTNTWWLGHIQSNADVDNVLADLALTQLKVTRVWGFGNANDAANPGSGVYYQVLNSTGQYFNCDSNSEFLGIPRLDYVISAAEKKGVKIVLPLLNNFDDLGGIDTYARAFGTDHNGFYTNAAAQAAYKAWIKFIVNRYKSSAAIFSWELCNEPRCSGCATSVITNWVKNISAYIKSLDSTHMVAIGDEGWLAPPSGDGSYAYSGYEGVDFQTNLGISTIDYGSFHLYPEQWGYNYTWGNTWITQHNAIGKKLGKPVVLEEYGSTYTPKTTIAKPYQDTVLQQTSVAYDSFWQFATTLSNGVNPYDNYAIYYNQTTGSDYDVLGFKHAAAMLAKNPTATL
ncbi:hypothetical protein ACLMJK_007582 [Lecanora helva]